MGGQASGGHTPVGGQGCGLQVGVAARARTARVETMAGTTNALCRRSLRRARFTSGSSSAATPTS